MNIRKFLTVSLATTSLFAAAVPAVSYAKGQPEARPGQQQRQMPSAQERAEWVKKSLDRQASMLEIKASQQEAWDAYAAAARELFDVRGERKQPADGSDAATMMRDRAEWARQSSERLGKLADATASLQAVLSPEQRKVLDRIVSEHGHFHAGHMARDFDGRGQRPGRDGGKPGMAQAPQAGAPVVGN